MTMNVNAPGWTLPYDLQTIYDHVAGHLLRQGKPAVAPKSEHDAILAVGGTVCRYRGTRGTKCAIGCLIPDGRYWPEMEGRWGPWVLHDLGMLPVSEIEAATAGNSRVDLLSRLQMLHDDAVSWSDDEIVARWEKGLADLAREFGLRPFTRDAV